MADRVVQSGDLGDQLFLDLVFAALVVSGAAHLHLDRGKSSRGFLFHDGRLVGAESSLPAESFASMLVRRNHVAAEDPLLTQMDGAGLRATQVLIDSGRFPASAVVQELSLWVTLLFVQSFAWNDGRYALLHVDDDALPQGPPPIIRLPSVLAKGLWKRTGRDSIQASLAPLLNRRPRRSEAPRFPLDGFDLAPPVLEWVTLINDTQTLGQWIAACPLGAEDAERTLLLMHRNQAFVLSAEGTEAGGADESGDEAPSDVEWAAFIDEFSTVEGESPAGQGVPGLETGGHEVVASTSTTEAGGEAVLAPEPEASETSEPSAGLSSAGVDLSSIRFNRGRRSRMEGGTFHSRTPGTKEEVVERGEAARVQVVTGSVEALDEGVLSASDGADLTPSAGEVGQDGLTGLFGGMDPPPAPAQSASGRKVAPPRGGNKDGNWSAESEVELEELSLDDEPPVGSWATIELEEWARITTADKERVERLCESIRATRETHYFDWFGISHESPAGALKKAYFQQARLYHPDALVDEPALYARIAETYFALLSEAYEVLSDDEARDKYIRKHIHGEKDEDELALETVQNVLAAENSFKTGLRLMTNGKLSDALRQFKSAVDGYPDEAEYVAYYGFTLFRVHQGGDTSRAADGVDLVRRAVELKPAAAKPYHLLGKIFLQKGEHKEARAWLRKTLRIKPDNPDAIREYRRVEEFLKGGDAGPGQAKGKGGLQGLFGRFVKEPKQKKSADQSVEKWMEAQTKKD